MANHEPEIRQTIISILEEAIESEIESEEKYLHAAELACDTRVKDFFLSLAKMEREHKEQLTAQLEELRAQMTVVGEMNDMFI
ncbi:MAG TPA: ferritin family protein [Candidatus Kryptobacter bacterium]|nr:ferritin family protein [Candidatus Kryptobacter bacterium]